MDLSSDLFGILIPAGVLLTSLLGSLHCASMCGGLVFVATSPKEKITIYLYHGFRLFGYLSLGALAGSLGGVLLDPSVNLYVSFLSSFLVALVLIYSGIAILKGKKLTFPKFISEFRLFKFLQLKAIHSKNLKIKASMVGYLSALLPCGFLYSFVLTALAAQTIISGVLILFFFWLGTIPALVIGPEFIRSILKPVFKQSPKVSGLLFISIAIFLVVYRLNFAYKYGLVCHTPNN